METVKRVEQCVIALVSGASADALAALRSIDFAGLLEKRSLARQRVWEQDGPASHYKRPPSVTKRQSVRRRDMQATFSRDRYTCRYSHCGRPTIGPEVLKLLSRAFPGVLPYNRNWKPVEQHILYWTYCTSLEHALSFPGGGTSSRENLLTACYLCNDVKNDLPLELLGWNIDPPAQTSWLGLTQYIPDLRKTAGGGD